ncbi:MAG: DnaD domain-containing protein, partial [Bacilli bacterium]
MTKGMFRKLPKGSLETDQKEVYIETDQKEVSLTKYNTTTKYYNNISSSSSNSYAGTNVFSFYENNFGMINPYMMQSIEDWIRDTNEELVLAAMERALKQQKQWKYAEGILKRWMNSNVSTLADVEAQEKEFARKKGSKAKAEPKPKQPARKHKEIMPDWGAKE